MKRDSIIKDIEYGKMDLVQLMYMQKKTEQMLKETKEVVAQMEKIKKFCSANKEE